MRNLTVELVLFRKREKLRHKAANPFECNLCGHRSPTQKSLKRHQFEKHDTDPLSSLFADPKKKKP